MLSLSYYKRSDAMELALDLSSTMCPHCGAVNLFPGLSEMPHSHAGSAARLFAYRSNLPGG